MTFNQLQQTFPSGVTFADF